MGSRKSESDDFELFPENEPALQVFWQVRTQWKYHEMSGNRIGIDYKSLGEVVDRWPIHPDKRNDLFFDVTLIEMGALTELAKQDKRKPR